MKMKRPLGPRLEWRRCSSAVASGDLERRETRQSLLAKETREFLTQYLPPDIFEVFPEWQGVLLTCGEGAIQVWIVRTVEDGKQLHAATGQPALLLEDVLTQQGSSIAEMWKALQPCLILSGGGRTQED